jgi:MtN3 and saliva related transmembrane protein
MSFYETSESFFGFVASLTTVIGMLPQVWKTYKTKSVDDVSMVMLVNYMICSVSWMIYGALLRSTFIFWSNVLSVLVAAISIYQKRRYGRERKHGNRAL